ncbi:MAG: response regulator, partial [Desulfobulbaceae bacterium]|nr:response regulator [Desulfobulbaceae bacterium]
LATEDKFDLILMDIQMPVMDGFEATRRIRSKGNEFNEIPVIAMTAHAMGGDREKSLAVGMNDHVTKPIDPDVLYATLLKYIAPRNIGHPQVRKAGGDVTRGAGTMELAGFDSVSGLKRVAGNQKLYLKLLAEFAKENEHNVDLIKEKVSQGDRRDACRLVHTLKGTAGNLGATSLHLAALNLERCIGRNGENFEELLGVLNEELQMALKILKDYLAVQHAAKEKLFPEEIVPISRESIIDKLRNIVEFSKIGDMKAASVFDDIYLHLVKMFPDEAAIMEKSMAVLDFSEARLAAEQILNKIME